MVIVWLWMTLSAEQKLLSFQVNYSALLFTFHFMNNIQANNRKKLLNYYKYTKVSRLEWCEI